MSEENATPTSQIVLMQPPQAALAVERHATGRLVRRTIFDLTDQELQRLKLMAQMYSQSTFNNSRTPQKEGDFFLIMLKGIELGIMPMAAVDSINIIAGKPVLDAKGMLALVKSSGLLEDIKIDSNNERCLVTIKRVGNSEQIVGFSMADAKAYKTTEWVDGKKTEISLSEKTNWKSQPEVMLTWRCVMKALRLVFSDIVLGLLTPEEMDTDNTIVHADGSMEYTPPVTQKSLPKQAVSQEAGQTPKTEEPTSEVKSKIKTDANGEVVAWYDDPEKVTAILGHCKAKGWIDGETIAEQRQSLITFLQKDLTDFESGKATVDAAEAVFNAMKNNESPKKTETSSSKPKKTSLSEIDMAALNHWANVNFNMTPDELAEKGSLDKYESLGFAKAGIMAKAKSEHWPVVAERIEHVVKGAQQYLEFETAAGMMRFYSRTKFKEVVGAEYYDRSDIAMMKDNESQAIQPLLLIWKEMNPEKGGSYNLVTSASPFVQVVPEPELG